MKALIIGGGIGGLCAAVALQKAGLEVEVYERAPALAEVGAGLSLWSNALVALDRIGLLEPLRALGVSGQVGAFRNVAGDVLLTMRAGDSDTAPEGTILLLHRAELLRVLLDAAGKETVRTGAELTGFTQDGHGVNARFADGREARGDLLIGADGLRSVVRAGLFGPQAPRYGGYTTWRAICRFPHDRLTPGETWGPGRRFGQWGMTDGRVYWYATLSVPAGTPDPPDRRQAALQERFRGWHAPIEALIEATEPSAIIHADVFDRPPLRRWSEGRVTLLGDAAHPMTPDMGQGACQAIEDAVILGQELARVRDRQIPDSFRAYETRRLPRTTDVVRNSRRAAGVAQWSNPLACGLREAMLRSRFMAKSQARQLARMIQPQV